MKPSTPTENTIRSRPWGSDWLDEVWKSHVELESEGLVNLFSLLAIGSIRVNRSGDDKERMKRRLLECIASYSRRLDLNTVSNRLDELQSAYQSLGWLAFDIKARLVYRGLIGAGSVFGSTAFEVGLAFDPVLNVPCIPGSSLKGAARAAAQVPFKGDRLLDKDAVKALFGSPAQVGTLHFNDAYPVKAGVEGYVILPDVLTPHYSRGEDMLREDEAKPVPVIYPSLAPGTTFRFVIGTPRGLEKAKMEGILVTIVAALKLGVGAKTSLGYGVFQLESITVHGS